MKKLASRKNKTKHNKNKNSGAFLVASENKKKWLYQNRPCVDG